MANTPSTDPSHQELKDDTIIIGASAAPVHLLVICVLNDVFDRC